MQGPVYRALVGNLEQAGPLRVVQVTNQLYLPRKLVNLLRLVDFGMGRVFGMHLAVVQMYKYFFKVPLLAVCVHFYGNGCAGAQSGR